MILCIHIRCLQQRTVLVSVASPKPIRLQLKVDGLNQSLFAWMRVQTLRRTLTRSTASQVDAKVISSVVTTESDSGQFLMGPEQFQHAVGRVARDNVQEFVEHVPVLDFHVSVRQ